MIELSLLHFSQLNVSVVTGISQHRVLIKRCGLGSEEQQLPSLMCQYIVKANQLQRIICRSSKYTFIMKKSFLCGLFEQDTSVYAWRWYSPKVLFWSGTCTRAASLTLRARGNCGRVEFKISGQLSMHVKLGSIEEVEDCSGQRALANKKAHRPLASKWWGSLKRRLAPARQHEEKEGKSLVPWQTHGGHQKDRQRKWYLFKATDIR